MNEPLQENPIPTLHSVGSLVIVNTGDGKGKSTAAVGMMVRAIAQGWKVAVVQFLKSGEWATGEQKVAEQLGVDWWAIGDGFSWDSEDLDESAAIAQQAWEQAAKVIDSNDYRLVILDEVTYPVNWSWIQLDDVVACVLHRPEKVNVVMTGRDAPQAFIDIADTVTEMISIKHAFEKGIRAKKGIDY